MLSVSETSTELRIRSRPVMVWLLAVLLLVGAGVSAVMWPGLRTVACRRDKQGAGVCRLRAVTPRSDKVATFSLKRLKNVSCSDVDELVLHTTQGEREAFGGVSLDDDKCKETAKGVNRVLNSKKPAVAFHELEAPDLGIIVAFGLGLGGLLLLLIPGGRRVEIDLLRDRGVFRVRRFAWWRSPLVLMTVPLSNMARVEKHPSSTMGVSHRLVLKTDLWLVFWTYTSNGLGYSGDLHNLINLSLMEWQESDMPPRDPTISLRWTQPKPVSRSLRVVAIVWLCLAGLALVAGITVELRDRMVYGALNGRAKQTSGVVVATYKEDFNHFQVVEFNSAKGLPYLAYIPGCLHSDKEHCSGDTISDRPDVRYLPSNPNVNAVAGQGQNDFYRKAGLVGAALLLPGFILLWLLSWIRARRSQIPDLPSGPPLSSASQTAPK